MASRLSSELPSQIGGLSGLLIENPGDHRDLIDLNLDGLMRTAAPEQVIRNLPTQPLYHAILRRGVEESAETLRLVTTEQLTRFLDYDVWPKDRLNPTRMLEWLLAASQGQGELLAQRFKALEEEYQLSLLEGKICLATRQEVEEAAPGVFDHFRPLPGEELFYSVVADSEALTQSVSNLIEALVSFDLSYALAVLKHVYWLIPNETESQLAQFRKARLEEDGFVSYEESLKVFARIPSASERKLCLNQA